MPKPCSLSRRSFVMGGAAGLGVGLPVGALCLRSLQKKGLAPASQATPTVARSSDPQASTFAMPGRHRGRVVEVHHPQAVDNRHRIDRPSVREMMDRGMCSLTGADHSVEAWKSLFEPGDVVGIKVNPVGANSGRPSVVGSISTPQVLLETVRNLKQIGIPGKDIIVFERYAREFVDAGYEKLLREREMDGVRWFAAATQYNGTQTEINGREEAHLHSPELLQHVVGYDPDAFVHMGFAAPEHDTKDDRRFRSHLSLVVSKMVNKFITLPVLKDHRSAGVTLSLKNMSHGFNNNVARSHIQNTAHGYPDSPGFDYSGPNQCNTFIPTAVNQVAIRQKATLHILDGLIGVYEGGPGVWNRTWGTWRANRLFFATDPVALDHVGWDIIDSKRTELGMPKVGEMGRQRFTQDVKTRMALSALAAQGIPDAITLQAAEQFIRAGGDSETFDRRQPEHIILAASIGLGEYDLAKIRHKLVRLGV